MDFLARIHFPKLKCKNMEWKTTMEILQANKKMQASKEFRFFMGWCQVMIDFRFLDL